jgi:hypothetical protein
MTALYPSPQTETYKIMCLVPQPDVQRLKRYRLTPDEPIAGVLKRLAFAQADLIDRRQA